MILTNASDALRRLLLALRPYSQDIVLAGGWVPFLYRFLSWAQLTEHQPLKTSDIDLALSNPLAHREKTLSECLDDGGFVAVFSLGREPPVMFFQEAKWGKRDRAPVYAEFLVPLIGSEIDRDGSSRLVVRLKGHGDVTAQALRFLELLLEGPLTIDLQSVPELAFICPFLLQIPHPLNYTLQKLLALPRRKREKIPGDCAYLFEVAILTRALWGNMAQRLRTIEAQGHTRQQWVTTARGIVAERFLGEDSMGPELAQRVLSQVQGSENYSPDVIRVVMRRFFNVIGLAPALTK